MDTALARSAIEPDVWPQVQIDAQALRRAEPLLAPLLDRIFPTGGTLPDALAARLAQLLASDDLPRPALTDLFAGVLAQNPTLADYALRDLKAVQTRDPACMTSVHAILNLKGFQALQAWRLAHALHMDQRADLAAWLSNRVSLVLGPDIHPAARIGAGVMLDHGSGIVIGETAVVDDNVSILQNVTLGGTGKIHGDRHPKVRHGAMIGAGAKIIGNIEIGACSKVAAGSVVLKSVPPGCTVAGIPARIVRIHDRAEIPCDAMDQTF